MVKKKSPLWTGIKYSNEKQDTEQYKECYHLDIREERVSRYAFAENTTEVT